MAKIEQCYMIEGEQVWSQFSGHGFSIYNDRYDQVSRIVDDQTGEIIATISLIADPGEGGGGNLFVESGLGE